MGFVYNTITIRDINTGKSTRVALLDGDLMYATGFNGIENTGTVYASSRYNLGVAPLFMVNGNMKVCITGTDQHGNTYEYKTEAQAGAGNAGYYVNGVNVYPWREGVGGIGFVFIKKDRGSNQYKACRVNHGEAVYVNGNSTTGGTNTFEGNLNGYSRMLKINLDNNGKAVIRCNEASGGGGTWWFFNLGANYQDVVNVTISGIQPVDLSNPYSPGGYSGPGGGNGNFSEESDHIDTENLPDESEFSATSAGLTTIFSPTSGQLKTLANALMGNTFRGAIQGLLTSVKELFVSLGIVPFTVEKGAIVRPAWLDESISIETPLYLAAQQRYEFDMGTIDLSSYSAIFSTDSVFDYSPYSRLGIYLPFIGYEELDIDECRNTTVRLLYRIDIMTGTCVAIIYVHGEPIYQFTGNCLVQIPMSTEDMSSCLTNAVNLGIAAASLGAAGAIASAGESVTEAGIASGAMSSEQSALNEARYQAQVSSAKGGLAMATLNAAMGMKPNFKRSGAVGASGSLMTIRRPYLCLITPRQSMPEDYQKYCGFPCNMTKTLGELSGYTVVEDIRLNGLVATSPEVDEIYKLLKSGVII